jgi:hypothetical protein
MTNRRHALAVGLAIVSIVSATVLGLILTNVIMGVPMVPAGPVLAVFIDGGAVAAFVLSWKNGSFLVSGLLVIAGIVSLVPGLLGLITINFAVIEIPGPILGFVIGLVIVGLGVATGIKTAKAEPATVR